MKSVKFVFSLTLLTAISGYAMNFSGSYKFVPGSCVKMEHQGSELVTLDRAAYDAMFSTGSHSSKMPFYFLPEIENSEEYGVQASERAFEEEDTLVIKHDDNKLLITIGTDTNSLEFKEINKYNLLGSHVRFYHGQEKISIHMTGNCRVKLTLEQVQQDQIELTYYYKFSGFLGCSKHKEITTTCKLQKIPSGQH